MRIGPRLVAAALAVVAAGGVVAAPVLAQTPPDDGATPAAAFEQVVGQAKTSTTVKKRTTVTTAKRSTATTIKKSSTSVAPTSAVATVPPTVATTAPLPTQSTTLSPVTAPATTAAPINDSTATRLVNRIIFGLVGLALLIAFLTFWYWRSTRPVPPALDGLDLLSTRKWLRAKPDKRARLLADYQAKRGSVAEEAIARTNAPTVKVGAAVAAPEPAPLVVPAMAGASANLGSLVSDSQSAEEAPIVMVPESSSGPAAGVAGAPMAHDGGGGNGNGQAAEEDPEPTPDPKDAGFTVVARRPRAEGGDGVPSPV